MTETEFRTSLCLYFYEFGILRRKARGLQEGTLPGCDSRKVATGGVSEERETTPLLNTSLKLDIFILEGQKEQKNGVVVL